MDSMNVMLRYTLWKMVSYDNMTARSAAESPASNFQEHISSLRPDSTTTNILMRVPRAFTMTT
ncbi:hypothetical protein E4U38_000069 [Claviceps purpurea]|nr:hypothetical protein E4U38_000069 [Claviceps purpurea]KAG6186529.1 hypothetical protein E4U27_008366 [Claviceps purpurea]